MPRIACTAATTGAIDRAGTSASISAISRSRRAELRRVHGLDVLLRRDLPRRVGEGLARQPAPLRSRPRLAPIDPIMAQQKPAQSLARLAHVAYRRLATPNQIAHRLVIHIWHPHRRQRTGAVRHRQDLRVAPVGVHPVARSAPDQRRRHDHAALADRRQMTMDAMAARPGLVT